MPQRFEYAVCTLQDEKVTFINDKWQGSVPIDSKEGDAEKLESCPDSYEVLNRMGNDGWELVTATVVKIERGNPDLMFKKLYLKRQKA